MQQSESPLLHMRLLTEMHRAMRNAGFPDVRTLQFPQPVYPSGWWSATLAGKGAVMDEFREVDARKKAFPTAYYSADIHRAAFALPPFMREAFEGVRVRS
ncbi:Spermine/spermidine synthase [Thiohalomonas denitrificans]|uniref:Spermine/spermidine synthase n=1 Tax=Thiohalomonas denitrificans TaxID=415747 RepID=A0A1G5QYU9_9GAMM|nr:Spermine/spermidine synthase [Thiohalomonas denitrificans]